MFFVKREALFSAAHSLRGHQGGCEKGHGHNYRVVVTVRGEKLDPLGMVIDFKDLGAILDEILRPFDHTFLNDVPPFDTINATAENMAKYFFDRLREPVERAGSRLHRVEVFETARSSASYME